MIFVAVVSLDLHGTTVTTADCVNILYRTALHTNCLMFEYASLPSCQSKVNCHNAKNLNLLHAKQTSVVGMGVSVFTFVTC